MYFFNFRRLGRALLLSAAMAVGAVWLCSSCAVVASAYGPHVVEGTALPSEEFMELQHRKPVRMDPSECRSFCKESCERMGVSFSNVVLSLDASGTQCECRNVPRPLSALESIGEAGSKDECGVKAWNEGYARYFYDSGNCKVEGKYEIFGTPDTKDACVALGKEKGYKARYVYYSSETKKCYGSHYF